MENAQRLREEMGIPRQEQAAPVVMRTVTKTQATVASNMASPRADHNGVMSRQVPDNNLR